MLKFMFGSKKGAMNILAVLLMSIFTPFVSAIQVLSVVDEGSEAALLEKIDSKIEAAKQLQIKDFKTQINELTQEARKGLITEELFNEKMNLLTESLKDFDAEKFKAYQETLTKLTDQLKNSEDEIVKLKEGNISGNKTETLSDVLRKNIESEDFKEFIKSEGTKKAKFEIKAVSVTGDYDPNSRVHITTRDPRVVDYPEVVRLNIRDLLTVMNTDLPYLAFSEVYDWDRQVKPVGENESLVQSSFKIREATTDAKRIGTAIPISKRMLRSVAYLVGHLSRQLPAQVKYNEDFQLLFGDGQGNNPLGIFNVASDFATLINTSVSGIAGSIDSIESYNSGTQTLINFTANQNAINNGDIITIADSTNYNGAENLILISPKQALINVAYQAEATTLWTFQINSPFASSILAAQQIDVLKVGKSLVTQQEYMCNGFVLNPVDATKIETLKGNDEHYLEVTRDMQGILRISGVPVVETTAMPAGKFALGDWALAAALLEFTSLILEFSESTNEKLTNSVMAIIQEEILFPIYNKYMFITGDFSTATAAISI